jgi:peptidyl-prolyl cis-trans isomerase D
MTMLDRMRRHKGWLKWSLALVVVAFILLYVPSFLRPSSGALLTDAVASVDSSQITVGEFRRVYQAQLQAYRTAYGGKVNEQLLKQLGIEQQILQQMVDEQAALLEARRQGITVSDTEVGERIVRLPAFQDNGRFIGRERYQQLLGMQRPPVSPAEFEDSLRRSLAIDKLRAALTEWITVPDAEIEQEFRRRNEKVKVDLVIFSADKFRDQVTVADADLASYFEAHKAAYRIGERRKVRYLLVDIDALRAKVRVPERDIERYYNDNIETYSTPEQVRASHILFKTEGKKDEEVKAKAEAVLKEVRAGKDFAELAKKDSEDEASASNGGDLDYFSRGKMVPAFDEVAFSLTPGQISDLVKTQYGYHIIKVVDKKQATTKTLDEVRTQITEQLAWEQAQKQAGDLATQIEQEVSKPADLDKAATTHALTVRESPYFTREEPILGLGPSPQASALAFDLADNQVSGAVQVSRGFAFFTVTGKQPPYTPKLDEVKDRVREDIIKERSGELARQKAASLDATLKSAADFAKAVKAAGLEVKTTDLVPRETAYPEIGVSPQVDAVAFSTPAGGVSDPIKTPRATAIIRAVEHKTPTPEEYAAGRDALRGEMLSEARNRFFSAYMMKAKQRMKIQVNRENLQRVVG